MLEKILGAWNFIADTLIYIIFPPFCPVCLETILRKDFYLNPPAPIEKVMRITTYREGTRNLLRRLKFDSSKSTLPTLKKILENVSTDAKITEFLKGVDVAVFVPLHEERLKKRGYNQVDLIFRDWLTALNVPVENILLRTKKTPHLFDLNPEERKKTLHGAFETVDGADIAGKNILIVDDIYTTGATVTECANALKKIDAAQIYVLAFASDFGEKNNA